MRTYLNTNDVRREYEAMMTRPLPAWLKAALFVIGGFILGSVAARLFL